jgi:predicted alpha/beta-fold hydrolase
MKKFEESRTHEELLQTKKYKYPIPIITFDPLVSNEQTSVFIFLTGLGGTFPFFKILNHSFFDNQYLVCYEKMAHGANKNYARRLPHCFVDELSYVVDHVKQQYPDKKIYLLGESWGTAFGIMYYEKHKHMVDGMFG